MTSHQLELESLETKRIEFREYPTNVHVLPKDKASPTFVGFLTQGLREVLLLRHDMRRLLGGE